MPSGRLPAPLVAHSSILLLQDPYLISGKDLPFCTIQPPNRPCGSQLHCSASPGPPAPAGSLCHLVSAARARGQGRQCQLQPATRAKDALLHGSAPLGTGRVGAPPSPHELAAAAALAPGRPQSRRPAVSPEPGHPLSDPGSSPWQQSPLPWAVTELDGPQDQLAPS